MGENVFYFPAETRSFPNLCSEQSPKDASQLISPFFHQEMLENATERRHVWNYVHVPRVTVSVFNRHQVASLICFSPKRNEVLLMEMVEIKAVRSCRKCQ